ncbi:MAG: hypothetical protein A2Z14_00145 [Chloroflexi bacterium RBG_16_48_8]|nr:MAG: hypothetical protein A2Z14_00145 [Chloroflexi bacterium RBG_16_48_8]
MSVNYHGHPGQGSCKLVVKEPRGTTRTGLAGAGRREVGVYQFLAGQLPLIVPTLIAASPTGDWLLMEAVPPSQDASLWEQKDYLKAIDALSQLHDRFWGLGEDLNAFPWLSRPLRADFGIHVAAGEHAVEKMKYHGKPTYIAEVPSRVKLLEKLTSNAEMVVAPLRREVSTFLHGDYWPGNISVMRDGSQIVYDWQLAAIGPAILDLLVFVKKSFWWFDSLPLDEAEITHYYRERVRSRIGVIWDDEIWEELWDAALMWRFLQEWLDLIEASPEPVLEARSDLLETVWLEPVLSAIERRLGDS